MTKHLKYACLSASVLALLAIGAALFALPQRTPTSPEGRTIEREERRHEVHILRPEAAPRIETGLALPIHGALTISCATCHSTREVDRTTNSAEELDEFHLGMTYEHGAMSCATCHNGEDGHESLRLADGTPVEYEDVMTLCGQCHGPQLRDYKNGSHGGMTGYWDLKRGGRVRNNCLNCHDPHAPAFQSMMPASPPVDRFVDSHSEEHQGAEQHD